MWGVYDERRGLHLGVEGCAVLVFQNNCWLPRRQALKDFQMKTVTQPRAPRILRLSIAFVIIAAFAFSGGLYCHGTSIAAENGGHRGSAIDFTIGHCAELLPINARKKVSRSIRALHLSACN